MRFPQLFVPIVSTPCPYRPVKIGVQALVGAEVFLEEYPIALDHRTYFRGQSQISSAVASRKSAGFATQGIRNFRTQGRSIPLVRSPHYKRQGTRWKGLALCAVSKRTFLGHALLSVQSGPFWVGYYGPASQGCFLLPTNWRWRLRGLSVSAWLSSDGSSPKTKP
jgi:hypothetical protein